MSALLGIHNPACMLKLLSAGLGPSSLCASVQITAGLWHSMALTDKRELWAWGDNSEGQLGTDVATPCLLPVPVHTFPAEATIMYVVAGARSRIQAKPHVGQ